MMVVICDKFETGFAVKERELSNGLRDLGVHCSLCHSLKKNISFRRGSLLDQSGFMTRVRVITSPRQFLFSAWTGQLESKESLK